MREFENYHFHTDQSNIFVLDSPTPIAEYAKRAVELGAKTLSTCEHGYQGNFLDKWLVAKKYNLKMVFAVEAYWVKDRRHINEDKTKDKTNCHIVIIAKDEIGRRQLTKMLSEANSEENFYYRPRLDEDTILQLNPEHIVITTACIAFWEYGYEESEKFIKRLHDRFGDSFFIEVQAHILEKQRTVNRWALSLHRQYGIRLIAACDSHYIYPEQSIERDNLRFSAASYEADPGDALYMDYPDGDELFQRFVGQGILPEAIIDDAIRNTLIVRGFEDFVFDKSKKVPNPYPEMSKDDRNRMYLKLIHDSWEHHKNVINPKRWSEIEAGIKYETDTIIDTDFADYFLLDYEIVKRGVAKGGIITESGRGSGPSYYTNTLLGFSSMNRFELPVKLYPDRFVSKPRLLSGKLPDLDLNVADRKPFILAQEELLGKDHAFPMIAYRTQKRKASWKMYARAKKIDAKIANEVSNALGIYDIEVKNADPDEEIDIAEYVPDEYMALVKESETYGGIIVGKTVHPCAILIYDGDIISEIGLVRAKSDSGKLDELVTVIDGATAEKFGYIKNDILRVAVWELIKKVYDNIGIPIPNTMELMKNTVLDAQMWDVFAKGYTIGVNQCERQKTKEKLMRYKPKNLTELSAFVAAVRPGFKSNIETFLTRTPFSYGIQPFDDLIQTKEMRSSFILYQENIMAALEFAGFDKQECYTQLQHISKKHPEEIAKIRPRFIEGFKKAVGENKGSDEDSAERVWQIISDASSYSFNASHSTAVAFDAMYIAYAKSHYPLETYRTMLEVYAEQGDKTRLAAIKGEMRNAFGINIVPAEFGDNNTKFKANRATNTISDALYSLPYMSKRAATELASYENDMPTTWIDTLVSLLEETNINARQIMLLIKLNYFYRFGSINKLTNIYKEFNSGKNKYQSTYISKTKEKRLSILSEIERTTPHEDTSPYELAYWQVKITGSVIGQFKNVRSNEYIITNLDTSYSPKLTVTSLARGTSGVLKMKKASFAELGAKVGDVISITNWEKRPQYRMKDGRTRSVPGTSEKWIVDAEIIYSNEEGDDIVKEEPKKIKEEEKQ